MPTVLDSRAPRSADPVSDADRPLRALWRRYTVYRARLILAFTFSVINKVADVMPEWEQAWHGVVRRHGLVDRPLAAAANWAFADATLIRWWDEIMSTNKARSFGFHDWDDSEQRFLTIIDQYRAAKILP